MIASNYANTEIGRRNPEMLVAATLLPSARPVTRPFLDAAAGLSAASMDAWRALVDDTPGFAEYFFNAMPMRDIANST